jgi:hypothetical protein
LAEASRCIKTLEVAVSLPGHPARTKRHVRHRTNYWTTTALGRKRGKASHKREDPIQVKVFHNPTRARSSSQTSSPSAGSHLPRYTAQEREASCTTELYRPHLLPPPGDICQACKILLLHISARRETRTTSWGIKEEASPREHNNPNLIRLGNLVGYEVR